jgi:GxxExxY protein
VNEMDRIAAGGEISRVPVRCPSSPRDEQAILALCDQVRGVALELHSFLRHGHLEKVYENGLAHRLRKIGLRVRQQQPIQVRDEDGTPLGDFYVDLLVEGSLIIELKARKSLADEHIAQALGYLRASGHRDALLLNFGAPRLQVRKLVL